MRKSSERDMELLDRISGGIHELESCIPAEGFAEPAECRRVMDSLDPLMDEAEGKTKGILYRIGLGSAEMKTACADLQRLHGSLPARMHRHNTELAYDLSEELTDSLCPVDGRMLDRHQLSAIALDVDSRLVIAGAGTGKTSTVVGLAKYLITSGKASPDEILFLSYTNSAVDELSSRISHEVGTRCDVTTFHRLALRVIAASEGVKPRITGIVLGDFVYDFLEKGLSDPDYRRRLLDYLVSDDRYAGDESGFEDASTYNRFIEDNPLITLNGDRVKSHGEADIADFLYMNSVPYVYEEPYAVDTRDETHGQYHPDFHISGTKVYIEYYGVDRDGNVAPFVKGRDGKDGSESYKESMEWKAEVHRENGTSVIPLYSYRRSEGKLLDDLTEALEANGIPMRPADPDMVLSKAVPNSRRDLKRLSMLITTAVTLMESTGLPWDDAYPKGNGLRESRSLKRFGNVLRPVYETYRKKLEESDEVDFEEMMTRATCHVRRGDWKHGYRYVVVDEYQDISRSRVDLLRAMRDSSRFRLFCVGDDWQSIYRFNGSDVGYILDFEKYWGPSETVTLDNTYRYSGQVLEAGCRFMSDREGQLSKTMHGRGPKSVMRLIDGKDDWECTRMIAEVLDTVPQGESVLMLGRYRHDVSTLDGDIMGWDADISNGYYRIKYPGRPDLRIRYMTIHGSKGLEADHVFILNNRRGPGGFPQTSEEPAAIRLLMNGPSGGIDEERRLMYVAMTRARKSLGIVTVRGEESCFVKEIFPEEFRERRCPECGGKLVLRQGPYGKFYGCSNYRKGCRYIRKI